MSGKGVTSLHWTDGSSQQLRLYYQVSDGKIVEQSNGTQTTQPGQSGWSQVWKLPTRTDPAKGTDIAAISWVGDDGRRQIRIYYHGVDGKLHETGYNGQFWEGDVTMIKAKSSSSLSAVTWGQDGTRQIRVYYVGNDNKPGEVGFNGETWTNTPWTVPNAVTIIE